MANNGQGTGLYNDPELDVIPLTGTDALGSSGGSSGEGSDEPGW